MYGSGVVIIETLIKFVNRVCLGGASRVLGIRTNEGGFGALCVPPARPGPPGKISDRPCSGVTQIGCKVNQRVRPK